MTLSTELPVDLVKKGTCSICKNPLDKQLTPEGDVFWDNGHNPAPVPAGPNDRCCTICNQFFVIPLRVQRMFQGEEDK